MSKINTAHIKSCLLLPSKHNLLQISIWSLKLSCEVTCLKLVYLLSIVSADITISHSVKRCAQVDQQNNILSHEEILEEEKDNQFSLGKKLRISDEEFEDLDEVIARYVEPMVFDCDIYIMINLSLN